MTVELLADARRVLGAHAEGGAIVKELSSRNTRGPAMHRIDRAPVPTRSGVVGATAYVPVPLPSGRILLLERSTREGGSTWATESLARRLAERSSCEVVVLDADVLGGHDPSTSDAAAVGSWCVKDRSSHQATRTEAVVVVGHGAGGRQAVELMTADHRDALGRQVSAWFLVSPSLPSSEGLSPEPPLDGADAQAWRESSASLSRDSTYGDLASLVGAVSATNAKVEVHVGGWADPSAEPARTLVRQLVGRGVETTAHEHQEQINGFFSIFSIPSGERTLQSVIRTARECVNASGRKAVTHG